MYPTTKAYKEEQKQPFREKSYVFVYIGVITKEAQATAYISSTLLGISTQLKNVFTNAELEAYYGTFEQDFYKADGSMVNLPRSASQYGLYQGAVSNGINGSITFRFNGYEHLNIKGLTIDFGEYYPTTFTVTNGNQTYSYENDAPGTFICQHDGNDGDVFNDTSYITVTPTSFVNGDNKRLRIISIMFGVGLTFDNTNILRTTRKNSVAHISDTLPSKEFSFTLSNINKRFAKDNPKSALNFLQQGQEVQYDYGRDIPIYDGDTVTGYDVYRIPGGVTALKTWASNDTDAKFTSVGFLDYRAEKYNRGLFYQNGITLYDLAVAVLADAGIENYRIDTYLKRVTTRNPLPVDTHKALLQMIANASRSVLYEDRTGRVVIESSFRPEVTSVTANYYENYCNLMSVVQDVEIINFFSMESNYSGVNTDQRYIQRQYTAGDYSSVGGLILTQSGNNLATDTGVDLRTTQDTKHYNTGFVSSVLSDSNGYFTTSPVPTASLLSSGFSYDPDPGTIQTHTYDPIITIEFEAQWTFFNVDIVFAYVAPKQLKITGYSDGVVANEYEFSSDEPFDLDSVFNGEFNEVNKIEIRFAKTEPYQRIHVNHVSFGDITDYTLTYRDMPDSPNAASLDKVMYVDTEYFVYEQDTSVETKNIITVQAAVGENEITLNTPSFGYALAYKNGENGTLTILESGAYRVKFRSTVAGQVEITGKNFTIYENRFRQQVEETGEIKTVTNDLICTANQAQIVGEWIGEYFHNDVEYSINYRGEPALDCDDLIYMENKYVDDNLIRVTEESIETSTGMSFSCGLKARRVSYSERT